MEVLRDLRYAFRTLRKSPAFTVTAILTLGLGIGANTAIFSVVDAVLLRPLPYPQPDRLAEVATRFRSNGAENTEISQDGRTWETFRDHASFLDRAVFSDWSVGVNLAAQGRAEYVMQQRVGTGFFRVLGVSPVVGREFTPEEDRPGGAAVAVLSHDLWNRAFHADPTVVGSNVTLRGVPHLVVGIMPRGFQTSAPADLWTPLRPSTTGEGEGTNYGIVARLKPGATWAQADAQAAVLGAAIAQHFHLKPGVSASFGLVPLQRGLTDGLRRPLLILWAAVGLVLLIACVNIASLLLARSGGRAREIAVRMAIGSGRAAVIRQLLAESLVLALGGGLLGVALGYLGKNALEFLAKDSLGIWQTVTLDARVLAATAGISLFASLLFGLAPALQASKIDLRSALVEGGGRAIAGAASRWPRRLLVVGEVGLGVVLLIGAGLLIRTFAHLRGLRPGFDGSNVITARLSLQDARYESGERVNRLFEASLGRIRELPGVESAAVVLGLPYERLLNMGFKRLDGPGVTDRNEITNLCYVTPGYLETLRIPLLRGRAIQSSDQAGSKKVVLVSDAFVKQYLAGQDPIGSHITVSDAPREIVGVIGDMQQTPSWGDNGPLAKTPVVYMPAAQTSGDFMKLVHTWFSPSWVVRSSAPLKDVIAGMTRAVEAVDPQLPFAGFKGMAEVRSKALAEQRFQASLLAALAGVALLLASIGIYGLIANAVMERTRELGIRMALGATTAQTMRVVALPGILLTLIGVGIGSALALAAARVLEHLVWGVSATDPLTFVAVGAAMLLVAAAASGIPALRVLRLDPAQTLRHE